MADAQEVQVKIKPIKIDDGWRKAAVIIMGMICYTILKTMGLADAEAIALLGGSVSTYLGINIWSYRRGQ